MICSLRLANRSSSMKQGVFDCRSTVQPELLEHGRFADERGSWSIDEAPPDERYAPHECRRQGREGRQCSPR